MNRKRVFTLFLIPAGLFLLTGCGGKPKEETIKKDSARVVQDYVNSKIRKQMESNPEHKIFRLDKNKILIISEGVPRAVPDPLPSLAYSPVNVSKHYDAAVYEFSTGEVSWSEITAKANSNIYQTKLKVRVTQKESRFVDSRGIEIVRFTPENWKTFSKERKNQFVLQLVSKLPGAESDYDKILSLSPSPQIYQENALLTLNWDKEKKRWKIAGKELDCTEPDLPKLETAKKAERTRKLVQFMNGNGYFLKNNVWCTPADHENLEKVNAGNVYFQGQWRTKQVLADSIGMVKGLTELKEKKWLQESPVFEEKILELFEKFPQAIPETRTELQKGIEETLRVYIKELMRKNSIGKLEALRKKLETKRFSPLPDTYKKEVAAFLQKYYDEQKSILQEKADMEKQYTILSGLLKKLQQYPGYVRYGSQLKMCKLPANNETLKEILFKIYVLNIFAGNNTELQKKYMDSDIVSDLKKECSECGGTGKVSCSVCSGSGRCRTCRGRGRVASNSLLREGSIACRDCKGGRCGICGGSGKESCSRCRGRGPSINKIKAVRQLKSEIDDALRIIRRKQRGGFY